MISGNSHLQPSSQTLLRRHGCPANSRSPATICRSHRLCRFKPERITDSSGQQAALPRSRPVDRQQRFRNRHHKECRSLSSTRPDSAHHGNIGSSGTMAEGDQGRQPKPPVRFKQIRAHQSKERRRFPLLDRFFRLELRFRTLSGNGFFRLCEEPGKSRWRGFPAPKTGVVVPSGVACSNDGLTPHSATSRVRQPGPVWGQSNGH